MRVEAAIVGCGAVVQSLYKRPLQKLERQGLLKVAGLVDKDVGRAAKLKKFFREASVYADLTEALENTGSQLAIITCPPAFHAEYSILALRNGSHVLCEKPMAITSDQCRRMMDAAQEAGRLLSIGMSRRYWPSLAHVKNMIAAGELGEIVSFRYTEGNVYNWPAATASGFKRTAGGGGILFDKGSHALDTLGWLLGKPSIVSHSDDCIGDGVEASCVTLMKIGNIPGLMHLSWDYDLANELRIKGTRGEITVLLHCLDEIILKTADGRKRLKPAIAFPTDINRVDPVSGIPGILSDCFYFQIVQTIRAIQLGEGLPVTAETCAATVSLIEECYRIAEPIDMEWLPSEENAAFRQFHRGKRLWDQ